MTKLIASAKIPFDGKELNLSLLRPYLVNQDRNVRREAWKVFSRFFQENADKLDEIYDKLVKNRTEQARKLGYENYLELGYYRMGQELLRKGRGRGLQSTGKEGFCTLCREAA